MKRTCPSSFLETPWMLALSLLLSAPRPRAQDAYVTNSGSGNVSVIDTTTDTVIATIPVGTSPGRPAASADGVHVYVPNTASSSLSVLRTATRTANATIPVGAGPAVVAVAPNDSRVYVGGAGGVVSVIDTSLASVVGSVAAGAPASGSINGIALSLDGTRLYVLWGDLVVIDTATLAIVNSVYAGNSLTGLALTGDGARLYVPNAFGYGAFSFHGSVTVIDAPSETVTGVIGVFAMPTSIAVSRDGTRAHVSAPANFVDTGYGAGYLSTPWVLRLDLQANTMTSGANVTSPAAGLAFSADGTRAYVTVPTQNRVAVVESATSVVLRTVGVGTSPVGVVVVSRNQEQSTPWRGLKLR